VAYISKSYVLSNESQRAGGDDGHDFIAKKGNPNQLLNQPDY
jgi:hypothetical protein